jgi:hypothetical protein
MEGATDGGRAGVVVHFEFARLFLLTIAHIRKLKSGLCCHGKSIPSSSKSSNNFTWKKQKVLKKSSKKTLCKPPSLKIEMKKTERNDTAPELYWMPAP